MGDNQEIYKRLGELEVTVGRMATDIAWIKKFSVWMFGAGGVVGAAVTLIVTRGFLR